MTQSLVEEILSVLSLSHTSVTPTELRTALQLTEEQYALYVRRGIIMHCWTDCCDHRASTAKHNLWDAVFASACLSFGWPIRPLEKVWDEAAVLCDVIAYELDQMKAEASSVNHFPLTELKQIIYRAYQSNIFPYQSLTIKRANDLISKICIIAEYLNGNDLGDKKCSSCGGLLTAFRAA
jgi:hypothetical protein